MTTGEKIKERRKELGLSQQELAERMGLTSKTTVCKMEKDANSNFTMETIERLAKALNVSTDYFISVSTDTDLSAKIRKQMLLEDGFLDGDDIVLVDKYHCLNSEGVRKLDEYIDDLLANPKYIAEDVEPYDYSIHKRQKDKVMAAEFNKVLETLKKNGFKPPKGTDDWFMHVWGPTEITPRTQFTGKK